jgi:hypothetical protein
MIKKILSTIKKAFFLDTKALGLMRIGLALIVLIDIATQLPFITELFSNQGILPPATINSEFPFHNLWTIHTISGDVRYIFALVVLQIAAAIAW